MEKIYEDSFKKLGIGLSNPCFWNLLYHWNCFSDRILCGAPTPSVRSKQEESCSGGRGRWAMLLASSVCPVIMLETLIHRKIHTQQMQFDTSVLKENYSRSISLKCQIWKLPYVLYLCDWNSVILMMHITQAHTRTHTHTHTHSPLNPKILLLILRRRFHSPSKHLKDPPSSEVEFCSINNEASLLNHPRGSPDSCSVGSPLTVV